jgi:hypothetical protein
VTSAPILASAIALADPATPPPITVARMSIS